MSTTYTYPPMPAGANEAIIKPSATFRNSVARVMLAMLLFIVTYIVLFILALAIAIGLGALGVGLLALKATFLTLVLCGGLVACGIMLIYFLVKFLFKQTENDTSDKVEVTEQEQPDLFAFIRQLTQEAGAAFPKRIYLSPEVNASVFYNSSFWSMFLPVKKNLNIGLGLVNTLNISEFKAVMAHEFGHFSQRSMKFGSYVYNMNRVIYNMLYDNEGYGNAINTIANIHSVIRLGILLNLQLIKGIQFILRQVYTVINKQYLALSRQMEFHADAVAAYVAGSNQGINCLNRLEMGQLCYDNTISLLNKMAGEKKRTANLYTQQAEAITIFGKRQFLQFDAAGIPIIDRKLPALNNTEVEVNNQWASHPSNTDRQDKLKKINLPTTTIEVSAWTLFNNVEALQAMLTDVVYNDEAKKYEKVNDEAISKFRENTEADYVYSEIYRGYYNERTISQFSVDEAIAGAVATNDTLETLLTDENCNLPQRVTGLQADISMLEAIDAATHVKTFDFRGFKYTRHDTTMVKKTLNEELENAKAALEDIDKRLFVAAYKQAAQPDILLQGYIDFFACQDETKQKMERYNKLLEQVAPIYQSRQFDEIEEQLKQLYQQERGFKETLQQISEDERYKEEVKPDEREAINNYLSKQWVYFTRPEYDETALEALNKGMDAYYSAVNQRYYVQKKALLSLQMESYKEVSVLNNSLT